MKDLLVILILAVLLLLLLRLAQTIGWFSKRRMARQAQVPHRPGPTDKVESSYASK